MTSDLSYNKFVDESIIFENINSEKYLPSIIVNSKEFKRKSLNNKQLEELKSITDLETLSKFLKTNNIENSDRIIISLKNMATSFSNFISKYPEFKQLKKEEKVKLIYNSFQNKDKFNITLKSNYYINSKNAIMVADPSQLYGLAIQACQDQYRFAFDAIWATADVAMLASSIETGGLSNIGIFAGACIATYFADQARGACMDSAAQAFYMTI